MRLTPPGSTLKCVPAPTSAQPTHLDLEDRTKCQLKVDPSRDKHTIKVSVGDDKDVARTFPLLKVLAMILPDL